MSLLTSSRDKADPAKYSRKLEGKALAMILKSLRCGHAFPLMSASISWADFPSLTKTEINLGKRETVRDVAKNLERMVQGIMIRTFGHENVEKMAGSPVFP